MGSRTSFTVTVQILCQCETANVFVLTHWFFKHYAMFARQASAKMAVLEYNHAMQTIGIIGGIGSGKSTVAELFRQAGVAVIAADDIGHQVLLLPKVKDAIRNRWGSAVFDNESNEIDRKKLAAIVFADEMELAYLKNLTHPLIAEEVHRQRKELEQNGTRLCLLDAPLLLESGLEHLADVIVFVFASNSASGSHNKIQST